jgi:GntR family transcriptional regulator, transcriptional repressor for pyruvate dehydrogenase complex
MRKASISSWQPSKRLDRGNAAEQILDDLRGNILSGVLPRGAKLPTEKQLAEAYDVSGATIREAIRGLTTAQLVEVRHGSGAYVTADADQLIAMSLRSMIQMEGVSISEVLGVLSALNGYAAELAAVKARKEDLAAMQDALDQVDHGTDIATISDGLARFVDALANASGNALLAVLCRFLASIQFALARQLTGKSFEAWRKTTRRLAKDRQRLVDAIAARDPESARAAARVYHERALKLIAALPGEGDAMLTDPALSTFLSSLLQGSTGHRSA